MANGWSSFNLFENLKVQKMLLPPLGCEVSLGENPFMGKSSCTAQATAGTRRDHTTDLPPQLDPEIFGTPTSITRLSNYFP